MNYDEKCIERESQPYYCVPGTLVPQLMGLPGIMWCDVRTVVRQESATAVPRRAAIGVLCRFLAKLFLTDGEWGSTI